MVKKTNATDGGRKFHIFTACVAKVMFSHVCVTSTPGGGRWATPKVTTPPSPQDQVTTPPSLPPPPLPGPGHNTSPPSPPGPGYITPPQDQVTTPSSSPRSQHPPPPGLCTGGWNTSYWNAFLSYLFFFFSDGSRIL